MAKFSKDRFYKDRTGFIPVLVSNKEIKLVCPGQHFPHYKSMGNFLDSQVKGMTRGSTIFPIIEWTKESNSEYELNNDIRFILDFCWARS